MRNLIQKIRPGAINEMIWRVIAQFIARHPAIVDWIIKNSASKPYMDIGDYMGRWWLTPRWMLGCDDKGRLFPKWWVPYIFKIAVHLTKRPDKGTVNHDHPCDNRSIVFKRWYEEEDIFGHRKILNAGQTIFRRAEVFHRITSVPPEGVWSLWFMGDKTNQWGYLVGGHKIYYRNYEGHTQ